MALKDKKRLILLGSSELGSAIESLPSNYLPREFGIPAFAYGHAYFELMGSLGILSSVEEDLSKDSKIVIIISPGWFEKTNLLPQSFIEHFPDDILKLATRNVKTAEFFGDYLLKNSADFSNLTNFQTELTSLSNGYFAKIKYKYLRERAAINNYFYSKKQEIGLAKPKQQLAIGDAKIKIKYQPTQIDYQKLKNTDWAKVEQDALEKELQFMDEASLWIDRSYAETYLGDFLQTKQKADFKIKNPQPELDALKALVEFLDAKGIKALFVMQGLNPYRYAGLDKFTPIKQEIAQILKDHNQYYLDLFTEPFEPGILHDIMHMGHRGWARVNAEIVKRFYTEASE